jgi:hypothetical protein
VRVHTALAEGGASGAKLFYGVLPGVPSASYEDAIRDQLVAAGASQEAAMAEVKWLVDCFASHVVPKNLQRSQTKQLGPAKAPEGRKQHEKT